MAELNVDLDKIQAEINKLSASELEAKLTKIRTREKATQKKSYNSESAKRYQAKAREERKAMKEIAMNTPGSKIDPETNQVYKTLWDQINADAEVAAEAKIKEEAEEAVASEARE